VITTYSPSGRVEAAGLVLAAAAVVIVSAALAWPYQVAVDAIPFIYVVFLATLGLGFAVGWLALQALRFAKCRNALVAGAVGVLCAVAADIASFRFAYDRFTKQVQEEVAREDEAAGETPPTLAEVREQIDFGKYVSLRVEEGWTLGRSGGAPLKGVFVWIIWAVEAGILVVMGFRGARKAVDVPFCETCSRWAVVSPTRQMAGVDSPALEKAVGEGNLTAVLDPPFSAKSDRTATFTVHSCPTCDEGGFLSLDVHWTEPDGKKVKKRTRSVVARAEVTTAQRRAFLAARGPRAPGAGGATA
jgi:hypothetical protein